MGAIFRLLAFTVVGITAISFAYGTETFGFTAPEGAVFLWAFLPLLAGASFLAASRKSDRSERIAWRTFAAGCFLWLAGLLIWIGCYAAGFEPPIPGLPDLGYLSGALCFLVGMFFYIARLRRSDSTAGWTFVLVASGATLTIIAVFLNTIGASQLGIGATAVSLAYPSIWIATFGSGIICVILYAPSRGLAEIVLLLSGVAVIAAADLLYGLALMTGSFELGTYLEGFWVIGFMLFAWAGFERIWRTNEVGQGPVLTERHPAEAFFAAAFFAVVAIATAISSAARGQPFILLSIPLSLAFALALGMREYLSITADRHLRRAAEAGAERLAASERQLATVLESTTDGIIVFDRDWNITYFNSRALAIQGVQGRLQIGRNLWELFPEEVGGATYQAYFKAMADQEPVSIEEFIPSLGVWLEAHAFPTEKNLTVFFRDVSVRRNAQDQILRLAYNDPLTGLGNRELFRKSLERSLLDREAGASLMCIDLDNFKEVNDSFGHNAGDVLLKEVSGRLLEAAGADAIVTRLGGDEFAVVMPGQSDPESLDALANKLIASLRRAYNLGQVNVSVGASIGMAIYPVDAADADELFCNADIALYYAKASGRGRALMFEPSMTEQVRWRQALRADLNEAIERDQFRLVFQPIVDMETNRVGELEALLRWRHPQRGEVAPSIFIPVAEESGLIDKIGDWVLEEACRTASAWDPDVSVSVNLSACQLRDRALPGKVEETLKRAGLPGSRLSLEVTESVMLEDREESARMLSALRSLGIRIALDDFGTGYSSLSYLSTFPFDKVKLDRSFVVDESATSSAILRSVVDIGNTLGTSVIAEGVETRQQLDRVRKEGCGFAQGYFFSKPVSAGEIAATARQIESSAIWWTDQQRRARLASLDTD